MFRGISFFVFVTLLSLLRKIFHQFGYFRLAELKLAENDRRNQESHLREQLLLAGIQDGPRIPYDVTVSII